MCARANAILKPRKMSNEKLEAIETTTNKDVMHHYLHNSLMLVTALNPYIGYENCERVVKKAFNEGTSLKEVCVVLGCLISEDFDKCFLPERMV